MSEIKCEVKGCNRKATYFIKDDATGKIRALCDEHILDYLNKLDEKQPSTLCKLNAVCPKCEKEESEK